MRPFQAPAPRRQAALVWSAALTGYVIAVTARTSFGVSGTEATERFEISASVLSLFAIAQLAVYAGAQVPAGLLLDRLGSRKMIAAGGVLIAAGHLLLAFAPTLTLAVTARVLVGLGDAATFVSALRLLPAWFPAHRVPMLTQLTSQVGQLGQIISAVPFLAVLVTIGWAPSFTGLAVLSAVGVITTLVLVRDQPPGAVPRQVDRSGRVPVSAVLREPGTWLGLSTHFVTGFAPMTFLLLWGVPFLTDGQGRTAGEASALLVTVTLGGLAGAPLVGSFTARHPLRRSWMALAVVGLTVLAWCLVLVFPAPRPLWQLVFLALALGLCGPASMIGFDFARSFVPAPRLGTATALVNVGGFTGAVVAIFLIGAVLDLAHAHGIRDPDAYRLAMSSQAVLWLVGIAAIAVTRRRARRRMAALGIHVPPARGVLRRMLQDLWSDIRRLWSGR
ncbi:MFS transporter [Bogoriella caseilytica]|uniref:Sugar phosphate permease n=1 Tax=Bogoriella caseilytica TaxID=56055 RepID=A0A3N2B9A6_9MICO|nr:MFS transporter [Bogoriella caseilytica]ROR71853.1 sugar phosphate permease [Bogoriella caseilytica]